MPREFSKKFYRSKVWQDTRTYIMKRDSYTCQDCRAAAEEVHHIIELSPDNINNPMVTVHPSNLVALCYECHKARHRRKVNEKVNVDYEFDKDGNIVPSQRGSKISGA